MKYKLNKCFDQKSEIETRPQLIDISSEDGLILINYQFTQKCYNNMEIDTETEEKIIKIYLAPKNMKENCTCRSDFEGEINGLNPGNYTVQIIKRSPAGEYIVDERKAQIK
jgi:hypothetical protein